MSVTSTDEKLKTYGNRVASGGCFIYMGFVLAAVVGGLWYRFVFHRGFFVLGTLGTGTEKCIGYTRFYYAGEHSILGAGIGLIGRPQDLFSFGRALPQQQ